VSEIYVKIVSVVGARPQFIKCGPVSRLIRVTHEEIIVHTGQHYDENMSDVFFSELDIPVPDYNLEVGSGTHGEQTSRMLSGIEKILLETRPDCVLTYGDTNSTLAGALAGSKLHIPVAHVEAGLRSYDRSMPEEINRIVADHVSDLLFCPTQTSADNLLREGIRNGVHVTGDVMVDTLYYARDRITHENSVLREYNLDPGCFFVATIHRPSNTDSIDNLTSILKAFSESQIPVLFPLHPRTRHIICDCDLSRFIGEKIRILDPLSYTSMIALMSQAKGVLTDSGGIQKEAYILKKPCITLRDNTEWVETVQDGWNILTGADYNRIKDAIHGLDTRIPQAHSAVYGDGHASEKIVRIIEEYIAGQAG
jgi:UDP-N-acetylglucosamine 2-epimerase (non-hydrolysing)